MLHSSLPAVWPQLWGPSCAAPAVRLQLCDPSCADACLLFQPAFYLESFSPPTSHSQLYQHIHWRVTFLLSRPVSWDAHIWSWWSNALVQRSSGTKSIEVENSDKDFLKKYLRNKQENVGGIHTAAVLIKQACGVWCADEGRLSLCVPLCFLVILWCHTHDKAVHSDTNGPWKKNSWVEGFFPPQES